MATRTIKEDADVKALVNLINALGRPVTVTVMKGSHRSSAQNRLHFQWINELSRQMDQGRDEVRAQLKLEIGVPLLREENPDFKEKYDRVLKPLSYEDKIACMTEPIAFPVTSLMTVLQKKEYLDRVYRKMTGLGYQLSDPEDLKWKDV